ncbi:hypothetical protein D3C78_1567000 [compost metagenome]
MIRGFWPFPAHRHIPIREQAKQRFILISFGNCRQRGRIAHHLIAPSLRLLAQRFALPVTRCCGFGEGLRPAAQSDISARIQQLLGDRAFTAFFQRVRRAFFAGCGRAVAFTRGHMRHQRGRGGILELRRGDVPR